MSDKIQVRCSVCRRTLRVPLELAEGAVTCPQCSVSGTRSRGQRIRDAPIGQPAVNQRTDPVATRQRNRLGRVERKHVIEQVAGANRPR